MRSKYLILLIAFCPILLFGQKRLLPVAKNGKWGLVDTSGHFILPQAYDYLEHFQGTGRFVYSKNDKKGVVNSNGTIFSEPIYQNVVLFDSSWIAAQNDDQWNLSKGSREMYAHRFDSIKAITHATFLLYNNGSAKLYRDQIKHESVNSYNGAFLFKDEFVMARKENGSYDLFQLGEKEALVSGIDTLVMTGYNYAKTISAQRQQLIDLQTQRIIGEKMDEITYQFGNIFYCRRAGKSYLLSSKEQQIYPIADLDNVIDFSYPYVQFTRADKQGVWNLAKSQLVIAPEYEGLKRVDEGYFVNHYNRYGMISRSGKTIVPVVYQSIDIHENVYVVKKDGNQGILSKKGSTIVPISYETIKVYDTNIKCYSPSSITVIKLDQNGAYKSQKTYEEYMTISIEKERLPVQRSSEMNFGGPQSMTEGQGRYGWFQPIRTRVVADTTMEYRGPWGVRDSADSVLIRPQYAAIRIDDKRGLTKAYRTEPFSLTSTNSLNTTRRGRSVPLSKSTTGIYQSAFHLVDNASRKLVRKKPFFSLELSDLDDYYYARGFDGEPVLLSPDMTTQLKNIRFYGNYSQDFLRVCQEGKIVLTAYQTENTVCEVTTYFGNMGAVQNQTTLPEKFMEIESGQWFFFDRYGKKLNEAPFQMAEEFRHGLAIVKVYNRWGVVDTTMNFVIPAEHNRIKRVILKGQSYFEVNDRVQENYLYNRSNGQLATTEIRQLKHYENGHWFAQKKGLKKWGLLDTNLTQLSGFEFDQVFPFQNGHATVIKKGKKTLIDTDGQIVLPFYKCKRIEHLNFDRYAIIDSRGTMVINGSGDTLLGERECKSVITSTEDYLVYEKRGRQIQFLNFKNDMQLPKESIILSYSLKDDLFLIQKNGKKRLFSLANGKYKSGNLPGIVAIGEESMVFRGKNGLLGYLNFEGDTLCPPKFKELEPIRNGWAYARNKKERGLVNQNGKYLFDYPVFRVNSLGENFTLITPKGMGIMSPSGEIIITPNYLRIDVYNGLFYKALKENQTYDLYTKSGRKVNDKAYQQINAIDPAALIVRHNGFDYLYNGFLNKSLSFQSIQPVSAELYLLEERRHLGLYNAEGELIIPMRYHKVDPAHDHFEVSFFNSFGHFKPDGEPLGDPYNGQ